MKEFDKNLVGGYCKKFREEKLCMTLTDFCNVSDENVKNVSAFENGRANNIRYLFLYVDRCNSEQAKQFINGLFNVL